MVNVAILNAIKNSRYIAENNDFEFALDRIRMGKIFIIKITKVLVEKIYL